MSDIPVDGDSLPNGLRELDEAERNPLPAANHPMWALDLSPLWPPLSGTDF
jgi:hypothetical protein